MSGRYGSCLVAVACWLIAAGALAAAPQGSSPKERLSHIPLPPMPGTPEISPDAFQNQLEQLGLEDLLQKVAQNPEKFLTKKDIQDLGLKKGETPVLDPNNEQTKKLIEKLLKQYEGRKPKDLPPGSKEISPDMIEALKKQSTKFQSSAPPGGNSKVPNPGNGGGSPPDVAQPTEQSKPGTSENGGLGASGPPQPPSDPSGAGPPPPKSEEEKKDEKTNKALMKFIETLKESNSFSKAIESLKGDDNGPDALGQLDEESGFDWDKFGKDTGLDRADKWLPKIDWKWPDAAKLPALNGPKWEMKNPEPPSASGALNAGGSILAIFFAILLFIVACLAAWKLRNWFTRGDSDAPGSWKLGPWPVQPALVRTREELVRAFEYLSLLRLGRPARNWNHRRIAAQLGVAKGAPMQGGEAAARLAAIYEHARYAPATDEMADTEFEAARRDLSLLAGVPSA